MPQSSRVAHPLYGPFIQGGVAFLTVLTRMPPPHDWATPSWHMQGFGINHVVVNEIAAEVATMARRGMQIAVVVGGGNFFRGKVGASPHFI